MNPAAITKLNLQNIKKLLNAGCASPSDNNCSFTCCISYFYLIYLSFRTVVNMTKIEIIDAAFKVWGRNFYRKTSLSQLAGQLKVSKPALYRHFENKQALNIAMTKNFFDDFSAAIRSDFEQALQANDADEGIYTIIHSIADYFSRNVYALIFSLMNIYTRNLDGLLMTENLKSRGVDMQILQLVLEKKYNANMAVVQMIFATLTFFMSNFHMTGKSMDKTPADDEILAVINLIYKTIKNGIGFSAEKANLDYEKLEKQVEEITLNTEPEPFFKAVAEAVAAAGPWKVSMEMVAKRLGLSKSSLYGHFKNRKDMLRRLFAGEFRRIIEFARRGIGLSGDTAEQLYLGIFSIAVYLRSRPEILTAMGWIRLRKLNLGKPEKNTEIFRLFEDLDIELMRNISEEEKQRVSHWILILLINVLIQPDKNNKLSWLAEENVIPQINAQNADIRVLYKFLTLGLGGFIK